MMTASMRCRVHILGACLILAAGLTGCRSGIEISGERYIGPPIRIEQGTGDHVIVVQTPSPGWDVALDESRTGPAGEQLFVTLREPDPRFIYAQVVVEQRIATEVEELQAMSAYARVLRSDSRKSGEPYRVAATTIPQNTSSR